MAELKEEEESNYLEDFPYSYLGETRWLECPNCGAEFDDLDDVQATIDDIEQELASKHEDGTYEDS